MRVFIDVIQAFPSMIVALALRLQSRDEDTLAFFRPIGFATEAVEQIIEENALAEELADVSDHVRALFASFQEDQWTSCDFANGVMASNIGCAAGVPLAGLIAVVGLSKISRRARHRLIAAGLALNVPCGQAAAEIDPHGMLTWSHVVEQVNIGIVDDEVMTCICGPSEAADTVSTIAQICFEEYTRGGLSLHLKPTKTAAMISWIGPGRDAAARACADVVAINGGIPFWAGGVRMVIPIVTRYKHVGSGTRASGSTSSDVAVKMACIISTAKSLSKCVLRNPDIAVDVKVMVARSHILPTGEYSSGLWPAATKGDQQRITRVITDVYRAADGCSRSAPGVAAAVKSDSRVIADLGLITPVCRVLFSRIRMLALMLSRGSGDILVVLHAGKQDSRSWYKVVEADLAWLPFCSSKLASLKNATMAEWCTFLCTFGSKAMALIKEALKEFSKSEAMAEGADNHGDLGAAVGLWPCGICGEANASAALLGCHMWSIHGIKRWARQYTLGRECPMCMRLFQNRARLIAHLHDDSEVCLVNLRLQLKPYDHGLVAEADHLQTLDGRASAGKGEHRKHGKGMVLQAYGPLRRLVLPHGHSRTSNSALVRKLYTCHSACRNVDYGRLKARLGIGPDPSFCEDDDDDLPLDVLFACEVSRGMVR